MKPAPTHGNVSRQLAPRLQARGWHLQWYAAPGHLASIARWHAGSGVVAVLDHLAGLHAGLPGDDPAWSAVQALADAGAWIKLSGWLPPAIAGAACRPAADGQACGGTVRPQADMGV